MTIAGYELRSQVEATIRALEHEKKGAMSAGHLEAIDAQLEIFQAELARMEETGEGTEHVRTAHPAAGTLYYYPPRRPGISGLG